MIQTIKSRTLLAPESASARPTGPESPQDGAEVGLERQIEHLIRRLRNDFPQVDPSTIRTLLDEALEQTRSARVQQFRSLLAERTVRDQLQRCTAPSYTDASS